MKKILVVDDDPETRDLIKKQLEDNKYGAFTAANGQEALDICKQYKPDLILLDIVMPGIDGYEVCKRLKQDEDTKDIPVLFLTAKNLEPEDIIGLYNTLGARGYIPKPVTFQEIWEKIKPLIG